MSWHNLTSNIYLESLYQNAIYVPNETTGKLELTPLESNTPWIPVNPLYPDFTKYPKFTHACPITVTVKEDEMLYLPGKVKHMIRLGVV